MQAAQRTKRNSYPNSAPGGHPPFSPTAVKAALEQPPRRRRFQELLEEVHYAATGGAATDSSSSIASNVIYESTAEVDHLSFTAELAAAKQLSLKLADLCALEDGGGGGAATPTGGQSCPCAIQRANQEHLDEESRGRMDERHVGCSRSTCCAAVKLGLEDLAHNLSTKEDQVQAIVRDRDQLLSELNQIYEEKRKLEVHNSELQSEISRLRENLDYFRNNCRCHDLLRPMRQSGLPRSSTFSPDAVFHRKAASLPQPNAAEPASEYEENSGSFSTSRGDDSTASFQSDSLQSPAESPVNDPPPSFARQKSMSEDQLAPPFLTNSLRRRAVGGPAVPGSLPTGLPTGLSPRGSARHRRRTSISNSYQYLPVGHSASVSTLSSQDQRLLDNNLMVVENWKDTPLPQWPLTILFTWLKYELHVQPAALSRFQETVKSVHAFLEFKNNDLKSYLGIEDKFERKRIMRALNFLKVYTYQETRTPEQSNLVELDTDWTSGFFLEHVGLPEYRTVFQFHHINGVLLSVATEEELERVLKTQGKSKDARRHAASLMHGWRLLKLLKFSHKKLEDRIKGCAKSAFDPIVWSNKRLAQWVSDPPVNCPVEARNLLGTGIHGALLVFDTSFDTERFLRALRIDSTRKDLAKVRQHIRRHFHHLLDLPRRTAADMADNKIRGSKDDSHGFTRSMPLISVFSTSKDG